ncbi:hypothetical protein INT43_005510 [Umbelopsis isabellina]|uniref:E2 ubiquitin-conjugating enzyme n=1 Tax=Mortierella isabellina TaxID=91625 RepID=A0A8H7PLT8_MORIS|nr:hypothetical protein INT43_005510 [Umbelopsis isabellina]
MLSSQLLSRLNRELEMLERDPPPGIVCYPVNDNCTHLEAHIRGPADSPFEDGTFKLDVQIPQRYPFDPPQIRFVTPIYHPNIDEAGRICADILKMPPAGSWKPALNLSTVLLALAGLMSYPNPDDPLEVDIATEFKENISLFRHKAKQLTLKHGSNSTSNSSSTTKSNGSKSDIASSQKPEIDLHIESQSSTIAEEACVEHETAISSPPPPSSKKMSKLSLSKRKAQHSKPDIGSNAKEANDICNSKLNDSIQQKELTSKYFSTTPSITKSIAITTSELQPISAGSNQQDTNPPIHDTSITKDKEPVQAAELITSSFPKSRDSRSPIYRKHEFSKADGLSVTTSTGFSTKLEPIEIIDVDEATVSPEVNVNCPAVNSMKIGDTVNISSQTTLVNITNSLHNNSTKPSESSALRKRKLLSLGKNKKLKM